MEDVLDLYAEPYDPERPVVCFDETSTQLLADITPPIPAKPGRPLRQDYEYLRAGTRNLFLTCEPLAGWRHVAVTQRRTMRDFAHQMQWLVDEAYPDVPVIRLVLDNLNTHRMASLYETFPAAEARRIAKRLEFHHTPQAWQLAEYGRNRVQRTVPSLSQGTQSGRGRTAKGHQCLRDTAQCGRYHHQLAFHLQGGKDQDASSLPLPSAIPSLTEY